jgi:putative NIF3 family GTP cyclohydrolase 1 type 2
LGNYSECSFSAQGTGTFKGNENANPAIGKKLTRESVQEENIEVLVREPDLKDVVAKMLAAHPYEEVAYDVFPLENKMMSLGSGAIGKFDRPFSHTDFVQKLKDIFSIPSIRFVASPKQKYSNIAICVGSGTHLLDAVIANKTDLFITGDVKYHQAIHAKRHDLAIADVGHFASEQVSVEILKNLFEKLFKKSLKYHLFDDLKDPFENQ